MQNLGMILVDAEQVRVHNLQNGMANSGDALVYVLDILRSM